jgi:aryl-alcohol dehydrogenase-like predicted oxidoreductase
MDMPMRRLGDTDLSISVLGLGGWTIEHGGYPLGWNRSTPRQVRQTLRHAIEAGINWIDTAASYGFGASESIIGDLLRELPEDERPYVFTKGGVVWDASNPGARASSVLKPSVIRAQCEQSLERLGVERIDLFQFHWPDELGTPVEESWMVMQDLVTEGKVRYSGLSGFAPSQIERCETVAHVDAVQDELSLLNRQAAWEVLPWCEMNRTGFLAWGALGSGRLCEPIAASVATFSLRTGRGLLSRHQDDRRRRLPLLVTLNTVARRRETTPPAVALAWALAWPGVAGVVVGARHAGEVEGWLRAGEVELTDEDFADLASALAVGRHDEGPALPYPVLDEWRLQTGMAALG